MQEPRRSPRQAAAAGARSSEPGLWASRPSGGSMVANRLSLGKSPGFLRHERCLFRRMRRIAVLGMLVTSACAAPVQSEVDNEGESESAVVSDTPGVAVWTRTAGGADGIEPLRMQQITDLATDARGW